MICGGTGDVKPADEEVQAIVDQVRAKVEGHIGSPASEWTATHYKSQVVAGMNYFVKVHIGDGNHVHLRIYKHFAGEVSLDGVQKDKTLDDAVEYFDAHEI